MIARTLSSDDLAWALDHSTRRYRIRETRAGDAPHMSIIDLERRLARIEAGRRTGAPTALLSDHPIGDTAGDLRADDALANWQRWTAQGMANVSNGVLCLVGPELTDEEWAARFVTAY